MATFDEIRATLIVISVAMISKKIAISVAVSDSVMNAIKAVAMIGKIIAQIAL